MDRVIGRPRVLIVCALLALGSHLIAFLIPVFSDASVPVISTPELRVVLSPPDVETIVEEEPEDLPNQQVTQKQSPPPEPLISRLPAPQAEQKKQETISVPQVPRLSSAEFQRFLNNDTQQYFQENPGVEQRLDNSYRVQSAQQEELRFDASETQQIAASHGVFMTQTKDGKRRCYGSMPNLLDSSAAPMVLSRDCTPPKKFTLE